MEIYKDLSSPESKQFEQLLNSQLSKNKIEEGKIIEGKVTKITSKYIFLFIPGLKSEPVVDMHIFVEICEPNFLFFYLWQCKKRQLQPH